MENTWRWGGAQTVQKYVPVEHVDEIEIKVNEI